MIQQNMLKWGRSSRVSVRWLESLGLLSQKKELEEDYQTLKGQISKGWEEFSSRTPELQQIKKDLQGFLTSAISYNYSFCEFLSIVQSDVSNNQIHQEIYNILTRFLFKYPEIGYTSEYLRILTFILCFCSQQDAFYIFSNLIYYTFPPPLFPKQAKLNKMESVEKYIKYMIDDFILQKSFEEKDLLLLKQFLSGSYFQYYQSIFVNFLPVLVTFSILDNVITAKEYKVIEKYTKALCFMHLRNMRQVGSNTDQLNEVILRNTTRIQELDKIISQNFKDSNFIYSLDMLDKETFNTIQAQSQSVDLQSQISNLKTSIQSMNEYSKVLHEELQKKNSQIEELNQRANEETNRKKNSKEEDELRVIIESLKKQLNETEMANKNLKVEVFDSNIGSMKKNKRYEDEIAGLNQMLFNCQGNLKQETEKSRQTAFHLNQLKIKYNEEGSKMNNLLNQERQRNSILLQQLQQERLIKSPMVEDKSYKSNQIGGSMPSSPKNHSIKAFSTTNSYENKDNNNTPSPGGNSSPAPITNNKSNNSITSSPAINIPSSPGPNEADIQRLQAQIQQMQAKLTQQTGYIDTMRSKGQQLQIAYNKLFKDSQAQEAASKIREQQNKAAGEEERKQAEEQLVKLHAQSIEDAVKLERQKGEQMIQQMKESQTDQHKKWQIQMQSLNEKMLDANRRCEAAQKTSERLLEEGKAHEQDAQALFQQQLSQKQVSIDQKTAIIREKEEEEQIMKSEIEKLKEQVVQHSHLEREIGTMQVRVHELEEELQGKNGEVGQFQEQLKQKNEEFAQISDAIAEMKLWKEQKQQQEETMSQKQKSLEEKQRNIDEIVNKFEQNQHRLKEEEIALQERQEDIEKKEKNIRQKEGDIKAQLSKLNKREEEIELKEENAREQLKILAKKEEDIVQNQNGLLSQNKELEARQVRFEEQRTGIQKDKEELRTREAACAAKEQDLQQLGANLNSLQAEIEREKKKLEEEAQRKAAQLEQCQQEESQLQEQKRMHENNLNSIAGMLIQIESSLVKAHSKIQQDNEQICLQLSSAEASENFQQQVEISLRNNSQEVLNNQETHQNQEQYTGENHADSIKQNHNSNLLNKAGSHYASNTDNTQKINIDLIDNSE